MTHGLTNMGGGLLTLLASSLNRGQKEETRAAVAFGYLFMGLIQYITLLVYNPAFFSKQSFISMGIALTCYLLFGRKLFAINPRKSFL
jgi:hypothetical protein